MTAGKLKYSSIHSPRYKKPTPHLKKGKLYNRKTMYFFTVDIEEQNRLNQDRKLVCTDMTDALDLHVSAQETSLKEHNLL